MLEAIRNTLANYAGGVATLISTLVFNAVFFRMVDQEEFGLISLLLTASLIVPALDLGIGRTAGRHITVGLAQGGDPAGLRDAVVTLQITNAVIALALGAGLALAAPAVAANWLRPERLRVEEVAAALALIGPNVALMMPRNFLVACLNGMRRQIFANGLLTSFALLRGIAGLMALSTADPLQAFFISQLLIYAAEVAVGGTVVWMLLPSVQRRLRPSPAVLRRSWRFTAGDGMANLIGVSLAQGDKLLLSALLPLSTYGAYALVSTIASGIGRFTSPFSAAFLPHFVELTVLGRRDELRADYLLATQLLGCIILPMAAVMVAFAPEVVLLVLGQDYPAGRLHLAFALLVTATILNNLMHLPHAVQLAAGDSTTSLQFAAANAAAYLVLIILATPRLGVIAPAASLFAIYAITIFFFARVTQRLLELPGLVWAEQAILRPGAAAAAVTSIAWLLQPSKTGFLAQIAWLAFAAVIASLAALAASPEVRAVLARFAGGERRKGNQVSAER